MAAIPGDFSLSSKSGLLLSSSRTRSIVSYMAPLQQTLPALSRLQVAPSGMRDSPSFKSSPCRWLVLLPERNAHEYLESTKFGEEERGSACLRRRLHRGILPSQGIHPRVWEVSSIILGGRTQVFLGVDGRHSALFWQVVHIVLDRIEKEDRETHVNRCLVGEDMVSLVIRLSSLLPAYPHLTDLLPVVVGAEAEVTLAHDDLNRMAQTILDHLLQHLWKEFAIDRN